MLKVFDQTVNSIQPLIMPLMKPFVMRVEEALGPGLTIINWNSLNIDKYIKDVYASMNDLKILIKRVFQHCFLRLKAVVCCHCTLV